MDGREQAVAGDSLPERRQRVVIQRETFVALGSEADAFQPEARNVQRLARGGFGILQWHDAHGGKLAAAVATHIGDPFVVAMAGRGRDRRVLDVAGQEMQRGEEQGAFDAFLLQHRGASAAVVRAGQDVLPGRDVVGIVHAPRHAGRGGPEVAPHRAVDRDPVATVGIALDPDGVGAIALLDIVVPHGGRFADVPIRVDNAVCHLFPPGSLARLRAPQPRCKEKTASEPHADPDRRPALRP
jgi:hypothetical protein